MASRAIHKMSIAQTTIRHLTPKDYRTKPWKNGKGQTQDILLLPEDADHSNFDVRFALSPIVETGPFSSFPGADRVITLVEGHALELAFEDSATCLNIHDSHGFDTGLAPMGTPVDGPVRVINVMARRGVWDIKVCTVVSRQGISCSPADLLFFFAIAGNAAVESQGTETLLSQAESAVVSNTDSVTLASDGYVLMAHLTPALNPAAV